MENSIRCTIPWRQDMARNWRLYLLAVPLVLYFMVFYYAPMVGLSMAFQNFRPALGILRSPWIGFENFSEFFGSPNFLLILRNTLVISLLGLFVGFPLSILFALLLNEVHIKRVKKAVQTISYMPYFISTVVLCGLVIDFVSSRGIITNFLVNMGIMQRQNLLTNPDYFWIINLLSDLWQGLGYGSIVFIAAITGVSEELHEAASIDGANRIQRVWHITLPGIKPMVVSILILRCGMLMTVGFEKILNLYNPSIYSTADVISTYIQRIGLEGGRFGYSAAVGLFNSIINTSLLLLANWLSAKYADQSLL